MKLLQGFWATIGAAGLAVVIAFSAAPAEAKRLGGGKNTGQQSQNVKRDATPATPAATPAQGATAAGAGAGAAAAGTAAAAAKKPWGMMLGGLAAGLGLAWLASSLGLGAAFGNILLILLVGVAIVAAIAFFMRKRAAAQQGGGSPYAFQGAGNATPEAAQPAPQYRNSTVGNDASARPWERNSMAFESAQPAANTASGGSMIGSNLRQASGWTIPADFDQQGFLAGAKSSFLLLQAAWDRADVNTLRTMMTDDMLTEIKSQLADRESHAGAGVNHTEVPMLDAKLLGIEDLGQAYLASVEFSGMIREEAGVAPQPFREVWNMTKPKTGGGWLVAGLQALS